MKPSTYISASLQVFVMFIAVHKIYSTNTDTSQACDEDDLDCKLKHIYTYHSNNNNNNYDVFDYTGGQDNQDNWNPKSPSDYSQNSYDYTNEGTQVEYTCYSCTFHVRQGNAAGLDNCRDPFLKLGIPEVPCIGACAKIYHKTSETEYTVTRICLPNCKEVKDEKGYTQCCHGHLCNGSNSMNKMRGHSLTLLLGVLFSSLLLTLR